MYNFPRWVLAPVMIYCEYFCRCVLVSVMMYSDIFCRSRLYGLVSVMMYSDNFCRSRLYSLVSVMMYSDKFCRSRLYGLVSVMMYSDNFCRSRLYGLVPPGWGVFDGQVWRRYSDLLTRCPEGQFLAAQPGDFVFVVVVVPPELPLHDSHFLLQI